MRVAILGSGRGSNAEAILKAQDQGLLGEAKVVVLVSDNEDSGILKLGELYGVQSLYLSGGRYKTKLDEASESLYIDKLKEFQIDLVVLAGFMRIIKKPLLEAFDYRFINLHPSLLPSFPGRDSIQQAFDYGVCYTGCTVHWVDESIDGGRIIDQMVVGIDSDDDIESLSQKIHQAEHQLLPRVVAGMSIKNLEGKYDRV